ncbi:substrate-binding domain-containing protein [Photobacterium carnosum]|uniref:substrate-binding domain-containing protein n=1 Tax=Photobacterium carnosum TaxID=2023717 RepID=UPI001C8FE801|nr:substrate-binding domain-containing protein [Photobacterium carnosum]MBY3790136.1 substrate-binding domain-containing protein [Photobacterium carnosum]MCD9516017.1 hypothetical protein [Photobacterium carnosum]MCD9535186.1 hypothetical protein [Photobacterium carnosum]
MALTQHKTYIKPRTNQTCCISKVIISFDDIAEATLIQPSLTVVSSPVREIGQQAGKRLLSKMNNNNTDIQRLILAPKLICRDSA